jgi:hypothetical protein
MRTRNGNAGTNVTLPKEGFNATMMVPIYLTGNSGSITMSTFIPKTDPLDSEDLAIASMSTEELLAAVRGSAGIWADRENVEEFILSGRERDRLEELYAPDSNKSDPIV